uniref:Elongator complex protein 5 n=1 Tax=Sarcoptes scabiei TaxID=52283 RepID=A0A834RE37_SARSC
MMASRKKIDTNNLINDILNDSTRLMPMLMVLIDDYRTETSRICFLGHLINVSLSKNPDRSSIIVFLDSNQSYFDMKAGIRKNSSPILRLNENDFDSNDIESIQKKLIDLGKNSNNYILIIDSINSLLMMMFDDFKSAYGNAQKTFQQFNMWLEPLRNLFKKIVLVFHSNYTLKSENYNFYEKCLQTISNSVLDFRLEALGKNDCRLQCPIDPIESLHCYLTVRRKHPRINFETDVKHLHFKLEENDQIKVIDPDESRQKQDNEESTGVNQKKILPFSSFRLTLNEDEQKAKDSLELPYTRKKHDSRTEVGSKQSEIHYVYDKFDDFDDEDPDDDLDF